MKQRRAAQRGMTLLEILVSVVILAMIVAAIVVATRKRAPAGTSEPSVAANERTVVIRVDRMLAGAEIAGDEVGKTLTVILAKPELLQVGASATFFGNPRSAGKSLVIEDQG